MAFSKAWQEAVPNGAVALASDIDTFIKDDKTATRERIQSLTGIVLADFDDDPMLPTKYGPYCGINERNFYGALYDNGTAIGTPKEIDWKKGNRQKLGVNASTSLTFVTGQEGVDMLIHLHWNTPGAILTFPSNVKWTNNTPPNFTTQYDSLLYLYATGTGNWIGVLSATGVQA